MVRMARPGDLVITLGAGSIGTLSERLLTALEGRRMSAVAAPADRRFRRAHVKPARTASQLARTPDAAGVYGVCSRVLSLRAVSRVEQSSRTRTSCESIASWCAATSGCHRATCWRC